MSCRARLATGLAAFALSLLVPGDAGAVEPDAAAVAEATALQAEATRLRLAGQQDEAAQLLEAWLGRHPQDELVHLQLGQFHADRGDTGRALATWRRLLRNVPAREDLYLTVSHRCRRAGLDDEALQILLGGRRQLDDDGLFSWEISQVHMDAGRLDVGIGAMLEHLRRAPGRIPLVESYLGSLVEGDGSGAADGSTTALVHMLAKAAEKLSAGEVEGDLDPVVVAGLAARVAIRAGRPERAPGLLEKVAPLQGASATIFEVAALAEARGYEAEAFELYTLLSERIPDSPRRAGARLRLGEMLAAQGELAAAEAIFLSLARHPQKRAEALHRAAELQLRRDDPRAAAATLDRLFDRHRSGDWLPPALALRAECALRLGDLETCATRLRELHARAPDDAAVRFELAQLAFYRADFEVAVARLDSLARTDPGAAEANDALELLLMIEAHMTETEALSMFARAQLLERQRQTEGAATAWRWLATNASAALGERCLLARARLREREAPERALALYEEMLTSFPGGHLVLTAQVGRARLLEHSGRGLEALRAYETTLLQFPTDPAAPRIRLDVRRLRRLWRPGGGREG